MNWGKWIIVSFIFFAGFIATLVIVCVREDVSLVSPEYYREEIAYQQQIDRINNTNSLDKKPEITVEKNFLRIDFPAFAQLREGELHLFHPANADRDKRVRLTPSEQSTQVIPLTDVSSGRYRAKLSWSMKDGKDYYVEKIIEIP